MPSENVENYLKEMYTLSEEEGKVTISRLSECLGVSAPSVTDMVKKLAGEGAVQYTPYRRVELTETGIRRALRVIRRHRLWELFLVKALKFEWHEVHEEAERLEHNMSEALERRIDEYLGLPAIDPHGAAIPSADGDIDRRDYTCLADAQPGDIVKVRRVRDENAEALKYASELGIALAKTITVNERLDFDGSLRVTIGKRRQFISAKLAEHIFVELVRRNGGKRNV